MKELLSKKEIKKRVGKIEALGMDCPLVSQGLVKNLSVKELNGLWQTERSIIKGAINDIELCL
jgi:hypothetical protein